MSDSEFDEALDAMSAYSGVLESEFLAAAGRYSAAAGDPLATAGQRAAAARDLRASQENYGRWTEVADAAAHDLQAAQALRSAELSGAAGQPETAASADLNDASMGEVARAWGSALPYENADPRAAATLDACEMRLRELHPGAMAIYDHLRENQGLSRTDAMRTSAAEFLKHPRSRPVLKDAPQTEPTASQGPGRTPQGIPVGLEFPSPPGTGRADSPSRRARMGARSPAARQAGPGRTR